MSQKILWTTTEVCLNDRKVTLAPLTLIELQQVQENAAKLADSGSSWIDYVNGTAPFIQASMKRAGGGDVEDPRVFLDLNSWKVVWDSLLEISGLKVAAEGESKPATA